MNQPDNKELIEEYSISQAAEKLSIPENTLRKYLNYFNLKVEKNKRKSFLSEETLRYLTEILQLKSNGLSLKQIKSLGEKQFNQQDLLGLNNTPITEAETIQNINPITENNENIEVSQTLFEKLETENFENINYQPIPDIRPSDGLEQIINANENAISENPLAGNYFEDINPVSLNSVPYIPQRGEENYIHNSLDENLEDHEHNQNENEYEQNHSDFNNNQSYSRHNNWSSSQAPQNTILTKDYVNKEIAAQGKRVSRLYRFLSSRNLPRDSAEIKADLDRRVIFLNGLRYFRDNWLEKKEYSHNSEYKNHQGNRREPRERGFLEV